MKRKPLAAALAGAVVLAGGTALYVFNARQDATPGRPFWRPADAPTRAAWSARVMPLAGRFGDPFGTVVDAHGNVFVADGGDCSCIRRIAPDGRMTTFAGGRAGFADGLGAAAAFDTPSALAIDRLGNLYVADTRNNAIRKVAPDGRVSTLAGGGAGFDGPVGVAVDRDGNVYVADTYNDRIRRIARDGAVTTVAGSGTPAYLDGVGVAAAFDTPCAIAVDKHGVLFVADTGNNAIRRIDTAGAVTTLARAPEAERRPLLRRPVALALTHDGYLYASGAGGRILQFDPAGQYHALADADHPPGTSYASDGSVRLYAPRGIAVRRDGALLVADGQAQQVFVLAPPRPGAPPVYAKPALPAVASMPWPVAPQREPHEVVGVLGEVRGSYDGENRDHFHAGLDIRADVGARVLAVLPATVGDPDPNWAFGQLGEGMSIGPLSYIHMRVGRDAKGNALDPRFQVLAGANGKPERVRVRRGTRFAVGDALGTINPMAHVHMEYYPGGRAVNALALPFVGLRDTVPPRIQSIALYDAGGQRLPGKRGKRLHVARALGDLTIVAATYDRMDGNLARRRLGLYKLGYQLLHADGSPVAGFEAPRITQTYDRLPREREAVKLLYAENSGITVYGSKATVFAYAVNNTLQDGVALPGSWKVDSLEPGDYVLRIYAADFAGQVALEGRDLPITVE
ncbi:gluconolaconase [Massilia sp. Root335]|uniref:gluconolaconase n=1 Tax=Massilia sp. Root335 TaxID=1736517 RepID=UPI0006F29C2C|nr:gluconolaconase [Massilia sp. Root335]KQV51575.1 gluconolaconase [Massilia sp. Root335]